MQNWAQQLMVESGVRCTARSSEGSLLVHAQATPSQKLLPPGSACPGHFNTLSRLHEREFSCVPAGRNAGSPALGRPLAATATPQQLEPR